MPVAKLLAYPMIGILSGLLAGLFRVGGGVVIVPALILIFTQMKGDARIVPSVRGTARVPAGSRRSWRLGVSNACPRRTGVA